MQEQEGAKRDRNPLHVGPPKVRAQNQPQNEASDGFAGRTTD
jgi:hypothetical protein